MLVHRVPEELYDFEHDPHALTNLAADPAHKDTLEKMRKLLMDNMTATADPVLPAFKAFVDTGKQAWQEEVRARPAGRKARPKTATQEKPQ